jgi:hypothetical protein
MLECAALNGKLGYRDSCTDGPTRLSATFYRFKSHYGGTGLKTLLGGFYGPFTAILILIGCFEN